MLQILASNWVAVPVLIVAALSLFFLYTTGRTWEVAVGAVILLIAVVLVLVGRDRSSKPSSPLPGRKSQ